MDRSLGGIQHGAVESVAAACLELPRFGSSESCLRDSVVHLLRTAPRVHSLRPYTDDNATFGPRVTWVNHCQLINDQGLPCQLTSPGPAHLEASHKMTTMTRRSTNTATTTQPRSRQQPLRQLGQSGTGSNIEHPQQSPNPQLRVATC